MDARIVPFGKYKGQPVEAMAADRAYLDWLMCQDWFRDKYATLFTTVTNNFGEPAETPEHNALQVKFLDQSFCLALLAAIKHPGATSTDKIDVDFEVNGWDVVLVFSAVGGWEISVEIKPAIGDDYPAILRQMKANARYAAGARKVLMFDRFTASGASLDQVRAIFAASGFTVLSLAEITAEVSK